MHFKVIKPSWEYRADGALALKDAGVALLEFAPAQQGSGTAPGERRYDWENKSVSFLVQKLADRPAAKTLADHGLACAAEHCLEPCRAWRSDRHY